MATHKTKIDGGSAWRWYLDPDPKQEYLGLVTYLGLKSIWGFPRFEWHTQRVHRLLARSPGLVGYSFRARFPTKYWTMSAWESDGHLLDFIRTAVHGKAMAVTKGLMEGFDSARWPVDGSMIPLSWPEALEKLDPSPPSPSKKAPSGMVFTKIADATDLPPETAVAVEFNRETVALFNIGGTVYAIADTCPHLGGQLSEGEVDGTVVACPLHGSTFDITTGNVTSPPAASPVTRYEVRVQGDEIQIATP